MGGTNRVGRAHARDEGLVAVVDNLWEAGRRGTLGVLPCPCLYPCRAPTRRAPSCRLCREDAKANLWTAALDLLVASAEVEPWGASPCIEPSYE